MAVRQQNETAKLTASASSPVTGPAAWASSPPSPGPPIWATSRLPSSLAFASVRSASSATPGSRTWQALLKNTAAAPAINVTAMSCATVSTPNQAATGTLAYTATEIASLASMTGRGDSRSTHAPAGTPMMTQGSQTIAVSSVTMNVLVCSVSMATSGMTTVV